MQQSSRIIQGVGVSPGIAIGKAYLLERRRISVPHHTLEDEKAIAEECKRFEAAVSKTESDLEDIKRRIHPDFVEHAQVLEVYQMVLRDPPIHNETLRLIREEKLNAQLALVRSIIKAGERFSALDDEYIQSRIADLEALGERVLRNLAGQDHHLLDEIKERVIIVAHDLSPADTAQLRLESTLGLVTDMGGRTSHTSIIARSLSIPAVVGTEVATKSVPNGSIIIIDGASGKVIANPTDEEINHYHERKEEFENYIRAIGRTSHFKARTQDGHSINVEANIELLEEVVAAKDNGAEGIGLYRTEFFFMNRVDFPDEEALYNDYRELAELMAPKWVTMRTLDLGAEKLAAWYPQIEETNPALGLRSIRLCLHYPDLFKTQLRAILRASDHCRNIRLMFPLVSGVGELLEAKRMLREVKEALTQSRIPFDEKMPVGVMIEVPSAVAVADMLAKEVDFFSIGTNDLIQYSIGIDRANEHVAYLFEPLHPAVLRFIKQTVAAGRRANIQVGLCGEMAGEPLYTPILLGLQLTNLSMNPQAIPRVKNLIGRSRVEDCRRFVHSVLRLRTADEINERLHRLMLEKFPEELRVFNPGILQPERLMKENKRSAQRKRTS
jgi:phosphoenolpyruvate-protein phosphotransferase (PTS system enzyme I)